MLGHCSSLSNGATQPTAHSTALAAGGTAGLLRTTAEAVQRAGRFLDKANQSWQKVLQVDLWAVCVGAQLASHHMAQHRTQGMWTILCNPCHTILI